MYLIACCAISVCLYCRRREDGFPRGWKFDDEAQDYIQLNGEIAVDGSGMAQVADSLTVGSYQLREISPPKGYERLDAPISFQITFEGTVEFSNTDLVQYQSDRFEIGNEPGVELPAAGGPGTRGFTILGGFLFLGAGVLLIRRKGIF